MLKKYHVGEFINEYMEVLNISETELANGSGVSRSHLNKIRTGKADLSVETANKISGMLEVKSSLLLNIQLSYIRFSKAELFLKSNAKIYNKLTSNIKYLLESSENISLEEYSLFSEKSIKYVSAHGFAYYSPNKSNDLKNYILLKAVESIPNSSKELDLVGLSNYVNTEYIKGVSNVSSNKEANGLLKEISTKLYDFGINFELSKTGLNTTINGLTKLRGNNATIFIENKESFVDIVWYLTHEIMHILNKNIKEENGINKLAERLLIGKYSNALSSIRDEKIIFDNVNKISGVNAYIFASIWRYKNKNHDKETRKDIRGGINDILHTQLQ